MWEEQLLCIGVMDYEPFNGKLLLRKIKFTSARQIYGSLPRQIYPAFLKSRCWLDVMNDRMMPENFSITLCCFLGAVWDHLETNGFDLISKTTCKVCSC